MKNRTEVLAEAQCLLDKMASTSNIERRAILKVALALNDVDIDKAFEEQLEQEIPEFDAKDAGEGIIKGVEEALERRGIRVDKL